MFEAFPFGFQNRGTILRYYYRQPSQQLRDYIGSFYYMNMPDGGQGGVRVEIPHLRFIISGTSTLEIEGDVSVFGPSTPLVCGPSFKAGRVSTSPDTLIIGASLTPIGWQAIFNRSVEPYANKKLTLEAFIPGCDAFKNWFEKDHATEDDLFRSLESALEGIINSQVDIRQDFLTHAIDWLLHPDSPGIDDLVKRTQLSHRQIDRLLRYYFGGSPKQVHRVFRALNISYRICTENIEDWRIVAGAHYDQAHFSKDFKNRIGCTPTDFMKDQIIMMKFDIGKRQEVEHASRYSLIG